MVSVTKDMMGKITFLIGQKLTLHFLLKSEVTPRFKNWGYSSEKCKNYTSYGFGLGKLAFLVYNKQVN